MATAVQARRAPGQTASAAGPFASRRRRQALLALGLLAPWIVGFFGLFLYPIGISLYYSFTNYDILQPPQWIGFLNYAYMVHDPVFWQAFYNTAYMTVLGVPLSLALGLGLALMVNARVRGVSAYRAIFYLPTIVPTVAVTIIWMWIFNPDYGLLNGLLGLLHLPTPGWLSDPGWSKPALLIMVLWGTVGQTMVVYLAGLQNVSPELMEAAMLDGAGGWARLRAVVLPALGPVTFYSAVTGVISFLQLFTQAFVATSAGGAGGAGDLGAPVHSTLLYSLYLYQNAFQFGHMGYASAMAWVLFAIIFLLTVALFGLGKDLVRGEGGTA
ncbi:MAG: sugar ABC transporter permease [Firmicutes bacterium]|nr:sugar ABC transporter permease [Bacillota bacterium]